ncbi:MAG TPA: glycosyltransferase [Gemmatimonadaceae bacterium]|nr:glycosyltransferase [Gemmatimonadaceae bacterium]
MMEVPPAHLRVAAIIDTSIVSGPGRQLAAVAGALRAHDVDLRVFTFQRAGSATSPYQAYLDAAAVPFDVIPEGGAADVTVVARLRRALDAFAPHVIQTHSYRPAALALGLRLTGSGWPWIAFFHGATSEDRKVRIYNWVDRRLLARADRVVVMSQAHRDAFRALGDRVRLVHNAVVHHADNTSQPASTPLSELPRPRVACIGRLSHEKGVDILLHAVRLLADRGIEFSVAVIGSGPEDQSLRSLNADLHLDDRVRFTGAINPITPVYADVDVVVLPSRSEGLPNVLLEALAADRTVVATRVGAVPEVLTDPDAGVLVPSGSADALADGLALALDRIDDVTCSAARAATVERFSLSRRAAAHRELYDDLLASRLQRAG